MGAPPTGGEAAWQAEVSPAVAFAPRSLIAFTSDRSGGFDVWVMNVAGSKTKNLTNRPASDSQPAWTMVPIYVDVANDAGLAASHTEGNYCAALEPTFIGMPLGSGSAWADFDRDGLVDLFVTNGGGPNYLYRNQGDTDGDGLPNFVDVAAVLGIADSDKTSHGVVAIDYDNDGDQDLYVTNLEGNTLYQNQLAEKGRLAFVDVTAAAGVGGEGRGITAAWGDFNGDGFLDLYVTNHSLCYQMAYSQDHLFKNNGNGTFADVTRWLCPGRTAPCGQVLGLGFAPSWLDYDNDGDPDLYLVSDDINDDYYENVL